jgi:DNA-binding MarR family transcriptional regulator
MGALAVRMKLSPGALKTLIRLADHDGVSMGEMARGIGCDPSYITALVDDLDERGLARRELAPYDRRVKIILLTQRGRALANEVEEILSVPPAAFGELSEDELSRLHDLLGKVLDAREKADSEAAHDDLASAPDIVSVPRSRLKAAAH